MATVESIMSMAAEKAVREEEWETIEWLFAPTTQFELLLRWDFDDIVAKFYEWFVDDSPSAMPKRHRYVPYQIGKQAIDREQFYRQMLDIRNLSNNPQ